MAVNHILTDLEFSKDIKVREEALESLTRPISIAFLVRLTTVENGGFLQERRRSHCAKRATLQFGDACRSFTSPSALTFLP